jgi:hypothetical protein
MIMIFCELHVYIAKKILDPIARQDVEFFDQKREIPVIHPGSDYYKILAGKPPRNVFLGPIFTLTELIPHSINADLSVTSLSNPGKMYTPKYVRKVIEKIKALLPSLETQISPEGLAQIQYLCPNYTGSDRHMVEMLLARLEKAVALAEASKEFLWFYEKEAE